MSAPGRSPARVVKRRPKDRKAQIATASAAAFSALGFHAVSMEEIASRVGISASALYRHSPSKYELFRDAVFALGQQLVDSTAFADDASEEANPATLLDNTVSALVDAAIATRASAGLYRWEARYVQGADRAVLMDQIKLVNRRLQRPLARLRTELSSTQRWVLSSAVLSAIGSIADHRSHLPSGEIRTVLREFATAVLSADLPVEAAVQSEAATAARQVTVEVGKYEMLLHQSLVLFHQNGYRETSMDDIAAAVGMPTSGIYRYFASKADLLAASFRRAADRVSSDMANIVDTTLDPERALLNLIAAYVKRSFDRPELAYVYYTEWVELPTPDRLTLHNIQKSTVDAWMQLLIAVRPDVPPGRARFAVHAAFALVVDLGRLVGYENTEQSRACVRRLMEVTLLGRRATMASPGC